MEITNWVQDKDLLEKVLMAQKKPAEKREVAMISQNFSTFRNVIMLIALDTTDNSDLKNMKSEILEFFALWNNIPLNSSTKDDLINQLATYKYYISLMDFTCYPADP